MQISDYRVTPIALGDPPLLNASGLHAPFALRLVVEVTSNDGITGVGEIPGGKATEELLKAAADVILGRDPFHLNALHRDLEQRFRTGQAAERGHHSWDRRALAAAHGALEMAFLDLVGKALGRPVVDLLGGRIRDTVPFAGYLFFKYAGSGGITGGSNGPWSAARDKAALDPGGIVDQARSMMAGFGFRSLKLKAGFFDPETDFQTIRALAEAAGPEVPLRIDPNAAWKFDTALEYGRKLASLVEFIEDPVSGQDQMARLRGILDVPLATNMCTTSFGDLSGSFAKGSEDIILSDPHFWGGPRACLNLAKLCRENGRGISMHSNSHAGVSLAAMVHVAAALPNLDFPIDTHYPWQEDEIIQGGRFEFEDGSLPVPDGPGLGVELDSAAVTRLHQVYLDCGIEERDDEGEMQNIEPGWKFIPQRW